MRLPSLLVSLLAVAASAWGAEPAAPFPPEDARPVALVPEPAAHFADSIRPVLIQHCGACHDPEDRSAPVPFLKATTVDGVADRRGLWKSVAEQLRNRTMPPADELQPPEEDRLRIAGWIEQTLRATACREGEFAGTVTPRRLNRVEYDNTIHDLLGVDLRASETFPVDGSGGEGFDNNGETLFLPPILMDRYLEATQQALDAAIVTPPLELAFSPADMLPEPEGVPDVRHIGPGEEAVAIVRVYVEGDYSVHVSAAAEGDAAAQLVLKVDGIAADRIDLGEMRTHESLLRLTHGVHALALAPAGQAEVTVRDLHVVERREPPSPQQRAGHILALGDEPGTVPADPRASARVVVAAFARRAFRRPPTEVEVERLLALYDRAAARGDVYEEACKLALKGVLLSPHFLFRIEAPPRGPALEALSDHELAVRLSYFLWATMPDDELGRLADEGRLHETPVLLAQVERMLDDPRSFALSEQFVGQWLGTREVGARVAPDTSTFQRQFRTELLLDMRDEPVHFFQHLQEHDRNLLELLDADYAILSERLAEHYELVEGGGKNPDNPWTSNPQRAERDEWRVMPLPDNRRGGVLGMGGVHMLTSYPERTSPVLRGGWILETLLGVHVPSPPPDVPALVRGRKEPKSVREQLAQHRENPSCAACHNLMDPLGFALDNFDVLGRWRDKEGETPVDASATLPSGESFTGPAGLRQALLAREAEFLRQLTAKMLGFALGRSLADGDDCTISQIVDRLREDDCRTRTLVREIVLSTPFRYRQDAGASE